MQPPLSRRRLYCVILKSGTTNAFLNRLQSRFLHLEHLSHGFGGFFLGGGGDMGVGVMGEPGRDCKIKLLKIAVEILLSTPISNPCCCHCIICGFMLLFSISKK